MATRMKIYAHLADLLDYPRADLLAQARLCAALLAQDDPQAARQIQDFVAWAEKTPLGCMEVKAFTAASSWCGCRQSTGSAAFPRGMNWLITWPSCSGS